MTFFEICDRARVKVDRLSHSRIQPPEIQWETFDAIRAFCRETHCVGRVQDITTTVSGGSWQREYDLPGTEGVASEFVNTVRCYYNGLLVRCVPFEWIFEPTGDSPVPTGSDWMGQTIPAYPWGGSGTDTTSQVYYIRNHRVIGFYPTPTDALPVRHDYIWCPDRAWFNSWKANSLQIADMIPAIWHDALLDYVISSVLDSLGFPRRSQIFMNKFKEKLRDARTQYLEEGKPEAIRGLFW